MYCNIFVAENIRCLVYPVESNTFFCNDCGSSKMHISKPKPIKIGKQVAKVLPRVTAHQGINEELENWGFGLSC